MFASPCHGFCGTSGGIPLLAVFVGFNTRKKDETRDEERRQQERALEGLLFLVLMWRNDASYSSFKKFLGIIGLLALLYPRTNVDYGAEPAYTDASRCEWKPWAYAGTRLVGLLYVLVALGELRETSCTT